MRNTQLFTTLVFAATVLGQSGPWGQCGGKGWTGATTCVNGWICKYSNDYYSQCLQGTSTTGAITDDTRPTSATTRISTTTRISVIQDPISTTTSRRTSPPVTLTTASPTTTRSFTTTRTLTTVPNSLPTLKPGYLWIRAVTSPNYHYYIQANSVPAVLGTNYGAGQFAIVSGQLTQLTSSGSILYAQVEQKSSADDLLLGLSFASTPNTNGAFAWSGDSLTWSASEITRPNPAAWYVCGTGRDLYINLGQYLYGTPSGCSDHTIHYYNDATPNA